MDRMKTFFKYAMWIILFFILSEFLINVGLNSSYRDIQRKDNIEQVIVYQAQATLVNGRVKGMVTNSEANNLNAKYVRFDFYSKRDILVGRKYIAINDLEVDKPQTFEFYFELKEVSSYEVFITDHKEDDDLEISLVPEEWTRPEIIMGTIFAMLIFW